MSYVMTELNLNQFTFALVRFKFNNQLTPGAQRIDFLFLHEESNDV